MKVQDYKISSEKFVFAGIEKDIHDKKLETKPVSYFKDALNRFAKNKGSILAFFIICFLVLFAIIAPFCTPYEVSDKDEYYGYVLPRNDLFCKLGFNFWDGAKSKEINVATYTQYKAIEAELGTTIIKGDYKKVEEEYMGKVSILYKCRVDSYKAVGAKFILLTPAEYARLQAYQDQKGIQVILPITQTDKRPEARQDVSNANFWYETKLGAGNKTEIVYDDNGELKNIYKPNSGNDDYTSTMYLEGETKLYDYAIKKQSHWEVRVNYEEYYIYYHTQVLKDGITKPSFILGTDDTGRDLFVCLASGARFSFILAIIVASVNLVVGAIYGAIEGYYGGKIDLIMERFCDILSSIPFMIVITLLKYHLKTSHVIILFISFFLTGWIGMAGRTRMQFYRFKNQEYVLVARTLGARDRRIMFKHIFPNAIGTLITGSVLVIPSVIFSETSLSYLNIINLNSGDMTSVGSLLAKGQGCLTSFPHVILWPSVFISLLMLSFNLFGNGLRDAFNPSLRGAEE